jgi:squalene synthase HpnC
MGVGHYENFPVASWLCPPRLRPAITAIYRFARTADDIADEGDAPAGQRLADLAAFRADLRAGKTSTRWPGVFDPLASAIATFSLPVALLDQLLDAFLQDVVKHEYADRADLLDYCRRSANPVGRLLLHLYRIGDAAALARSDAICTALQLINFWQDLSIDLPRGRVYLPQADCRRFGVAPEQLRVGYGGSAVRALVADACAWARALMEEGAPLVHAVPGRAGLELRLVVQGGLRTLRRIESIGYATLLARPRLRLLDVAPMLWNAARM